jgi:hypothetical protein
MIKRKKRGNNPAGHRRGAVPPWARVAPRSLCQGRFAPASPVPAHSRAARRFTPSGLKSVRTQVRAHRPRAPRSPPSTLWRLTLVPSSGEYSPISQADLASSKPTKSVASSSHSITASAISSARSVGIDAQHLGDVRAFMSRPDADFDGFTRLHGVDATLSQHAPVEECVARPI